MKRNKINPEIVITITKFAILFCIAIFQFSTLSEAQAAGKILIRKTPGSDIDIPKTADPAAAFGVNSDWTPSQVQKNPGRNSFNVIEIRKGIGKVAPENPKETRNPEDGRLHYEGEVRLNDGSIVINVKTVGNKAHVMLPVPSDIEVISPNSLFDRGANISDFQQSNLRSDEIFLATISRRIVVWNGKEDKTGEQLLICSEQPRSSSGKLEAVLNITPLPGQPSLIKRTADIFNGLEAKVDDLINNKGGDNEVVNPKPEEWNGRITPYCVQAIQVSNRNLGEFLRKAENMVSNLYGDRARLDWQPMQLSAIQHLLDLGYQWFALDVSLLRNWGTITEPIAYYTQSDAARISLFDETIGRADSSPAITNALVITPKKVMLKDDNLTEEEAVAIGPKSVELTVEELQKLAPEVAAFCKKHNMEKVFVQHIFVESKNKEYIGELKMGIAPEEPVAQSGSGETPAVLKSDANKDAVDKADAAADKKTDAGKDAPKKVDPVSQGPVSNKAVPETPNPVSQGPISNKAVPETPNPVSQGPISNKAVPETPNPVTQGPISNRVIPNTQRTVSPVLPRINK